MKYLNFKRNFLIILILVLAFLIRIIGITPGFNNHHPDEGMSYTSATEMIQNGDINPRRFDYPSGVPLLHFLIYKTVILPVVMIMMFIDNPQTIFDSIGLGFNFFQEYSVQIFGRGYVNALFWSRYITAILGVLSIFIIYLIGTRLFNKTTGIVAALFLTFNYRHVLSSHLALSDIPNSFFMLLAFYGSILLYEKNSLRRYLLAGLLVGLSFSMKYQILAFLPFLFAHLSWAFRKKSPSLLIDKRFIIGSILIPLIFVILNPYLLLNLGSAIPVIKRVSLRYGSGINSFNFYPVYYYYHFGMGPLVFLTVFIGLMITFLKQKMKSLLILSYVIPFLYIFLYYMSGGTYVRNFTTVMPLLFLFVGYAFSLVVEKGKKIIKSEVMRLTILVVVILLINFVSIRNSLLLAFEYERPWNRDTLIDWASENLPSNVSIRNDNLALEYVKEKGRKIIQLEQRAENSIAEFQELGDDFVVINIFWNYNLFFWWFGLDPLNMLKYGPIPYSLLSDTYWGISLEELTNYSVYEVYKVWQSPEFNYFIVKIPPKPTGSLKVMSSFSFDTSSQKWKVRRRFDESNNNIGLTFDNSNGKSKKGSLVFKGGMGANFYSRYESEFIRIKQDTFYKVQGFLKASTPLETRERDGFIRVDFFDKNKNPVQGLNILKRVVSARVFDTTDWTEKTINVKSPSNAQFLTISFQRNFASRDYAIWLDDVRLYEIDKTPSEPYPKLPYIKSTIPMNILYPNSIM